MIRDKKILWSRGVTLALIVLAFVSGLYLGVSKRPAIDKVTSLLNKESAIVFESEKTDFDPFWRAWNLINERYAAPNGTTTDQEKVWGAIEGLTKSLKDPYSVFLPPADAQLFEESLSGNFGGVGMEIGMRDEVVTVIAPLKNTPAERAGILAGDQIVKINKESTAGMTVDEAVRLIRGEVGTKVELTLARKGEDEFIEKEVVRAVISIPTVDTEKRDDGIFIIKLYTFGATSPGLFKQALREFVLTNHEKLILDLRGNAGGFLDAAVDIASWFLPSGTIVTTEDYGGREENVVHRSKGYNIFNEKLKMVILVDGGSASASEILAGALSEHDVARLVGEKTFGKGSVQELLKVTPDTSLKLTIAHWKTPNGRIISKEGIVPEFEVKRTAKDKEAEKDPQLEKAVEILQN